MFGFQRVGDLIWAAGDMRAKGFFLGGTAGRTTLNGEGLQHQDGHSHVAALSIPNLKAYDPAYAYELAVIIRDGIERMYAKQEDLFYYLTVMNENYPMPAMPKGAREGILRGIYRLARARAAKGKPRAHLLGSGTILNEARAAQGLLRGYGVAADVWSVTSYKELYNDINAVERWNALHPGERRQSYLQQAFAGEQGVCVAASDYLKVLPRALATHLPGALVALGTDGFGRSETRDALRDFFQVDARHITVTALGALAAAGEVAPELARRALARPEGGPPRPPVRSPASSAPKPPSRAGGRSPAAAADVPYCRRVEDRSWPARCPLPPLSTSPAPAARRLRKAIQRAGHAPASDSHNANHLLAER